MLNRVILMGRLVSDPELKTTNSGLSVTSFRIAVDRNYVKSGEERKADFIDIVCWRSTAEFVCRFFGKGSMIALEGQLQTRTYQAKDGTNRYVVEVVADNVSARSRPIPHRHSSLISRRRHIRSSPRPLIRAEPTPIFRICRSTTIYHSDFKN